jgi:hypothetical protein
LMFSRTCTRSTGFVVSLALPFVDFFAECFPDFFAVPVRFPLAFFLLTARPPKNCRRYPESRLQPRQSYEQQRLNPQIPRRQCAKLRCKLGYSAQKAKGALFSAPR